MLWSLLTEWLLQENTRFIFLEVEFFRKRALSWDRCRALLPGLWGQPLWEGGAGPAAPGGSSSPGPHTHGAPDHRCPCHGEREAGPGTSAWTVTLGRLVPQGALALGEAVLWSPQQQGSPRRSGCQDHPAPSHPQLGSGVLGVLTAPTTSLVNLLWFLQNKPFWTKTFFFFCDYPFLIFPIEDVC